MYIRYFASTEARSPVAMVALAYLRSLIRLAPVRVIDPGRMIPGAPEGAWARHASLFYTPMIGAYVNVVCTSPSRWTWLQRVAATKSNTPSASAPDEMIEGRLELYTAGVRNVLLIAEAPTEPAEYATALKYDAILTHAIHIVREWPGGCGIYPTIVPIPVTDHAAIREAVLGPPFG